MAAQAKTKGSWGLRFFIVVLGIILGVLFYWLLSFVENDIGKIKGLRWEDVRRGYVSEAADATREALRNESEDLNRRIRTLTEEMNFVERSRSNQQNTIDQLLRLQIESIEKGIPFSEENRAMLQQSQVTFVENQQKYEQYNAEIAELTRVLREKEGELSRLDEQIGQQEKLAEKKYDFKNAVFKLAFLLPVLVGVFYLFMRWRTSAYWPLAWAVFAAAFIKVAMVVHHHFRTPYFKYIALAVIIAIVLKLFVYLIRLLIAPKKDLLLKQYQQDYDKCQCPVCGKPIRTGVLRYAGCLKKKSIVMTEPAGGQAEQGPYTCPSCGTTLYDKCEGCGGVRHSLLPYCEHCGKEKESGQSEGK